MKLSEAIRLGATMKPQWFFSIVSEDGLRTCAMGAAYDAVGMLRLTENGQFKIPVGFKRWKIMDILSTCPACGTRLSVTIIVMHLNDSPKPGHRWTRERIADWVELEEVRLMTPDEIPDPIPTPSEAPVEVA